MKPVQSKVPVVQPKQASVPAQPDQADQGDPMLFKVWPRLYSTKYGKKMHVSKDSPGRRPVHGTQLWTLENNVQLPRSYVHAAQAGAAAAVHEVQHWA